MNFEIIVLLLAVLMLCLMCFVSCLIVVAVVIIGNRNPNYVKRHKHYAKMVEKKPEVAHNEKADATRPDLDSIWDDSEALKSIREDLVSNLNAPSAEPILAGRTDVESWRLVDARILDLENPRMTDL